MKHTFEPSKTRISKPMDAKFFVSSNSAFSNLITEKEAKNLLKGVISPEAELVSYKICPYSEENLGFSGANLLKLHLESRQPEGGSSETRSFFVKTVPIGVSVQADCVNENGTFIKETGFFREIMPLMMKKYKGEAWAPKCYLLKGMQTLVFEDIGAEGFSNRPKFLDEASVMSTVTCLARFHACSLLAEELLNGKSLFELYSSVFEESEYRKTGHNYQWFTASVDYLIILADEMGLDSSRLSEACSRVFDVCVPSRNKRNVLSHGDLWSYNIMFDKTDRCRFVDFQLIRYAPLAHDLMMFLYLCTLREFREKKEDDIIDLYYKTLQQTLKSCGYKGQAPNFQELKQGVEEQRLPALAIAAVAFQMILIDSKNMSEIIKNSDMHEEYFFKSRKPIIDKIMAQDRVFEKSMRGITRELVAMSLRLDDLPRMT